MYAWIVPDIISSAVDRPFLYKVPEHSVSKAELGKIVSVPFGRGNKIQKGYILGLEEEIHPSDKRLNGKKPAKMRIKEILSVEEGSCELSKENLELADFLKKRYGSTMAAAIRTVMVRDPKSLRKKKKEVVAVADQTELQAYLEHQYRKNNKARIRIAEALLLHSRIEYGIVTKDLKIPAKLLNLLQEEGILNVQEVAEDVRTHREASKPDTPALNPNQRRVSDGIYQFSVEKLEKGLPAVSLLHGITGSGKTLVYMDLISKVLAEGKQAILLIPEISLTMQNIMKFNAGFQNRVSFIHSKLSKSEKQERFDMAYRSEIDIMIGPRSALFTPFRQIGIIIIDEEHESSYNSDRMPKYSSVEVAVRLAGLHRAMVVLGSATPSVESYYKAKQGEYGLFELKERFGGASLPKVHIVDMKKELLAGNRTMFSRKLLEFIADRLEKKEQIMLFLNRRGYFGFNSCRSCGSVMQCPHCDVSLSLHKDGKLKCHYCGYSVIRYRCCPVCGSEFIGSMNAGTQHVEEELVRCFPGIKVLRMDADTTGKKHDMEGIIESFSKGGADVLIGTQMIVKGHDFKRVTLMGILLADMSLNLSSYTASERSFQLLMQAAGRAGRADIKGEVVMQTYRPEHFSIVEAAAQNYSGFYEEEIKYRQLLGYPPFAYLLHLNMQYKDEEYLKKAADFMKQYLDMASKRNRVEVIGPGIPMIPKVNDLYRRSIYLKHPKIEVLLALRDRIEDYISLNKGYEGMDIQFDYQVN